MSEKSMHKDTSIDEALVAKHKLKKKKMQIKNAGVDIQIQGLDNNNNNNKKTSSFLCSMQLPCDRESVLMQRVRLCKPGPWKKPFTMRSLQKSL